MAEETQKYWQTIARGSSWDGMSANRKRLEEKMNLTKLDTVFLFTFTIITTTMSLLGFLSGTFRGLIPLAIILLAAYPFYIGTWHGIMNDNVPARLVAWHYLLLQFTFLIIMFAEMLIALPMQSGAPYSDIMALLPILILSLIPGVVVLVVLLLLEERMWRALVTVFRRTLPFRRNEISISHLDKMSNRYAGRVSIFLTASTIIELFAVQEWTLSTGLLAKPMIPYTVEAGIAISLIAFICWLAGFENLKQTPKLPTPKTKKKMKHTAKATNTHTSTGKKTLALEHSP